jgi:hypothetical protein
MMDGDYNGNNMGVGEIIDLTAGSKGTSRIVLRVRDYSDDVGEVRFAIDEHMTPLGEIFHRYMGYMDTKVVGGDVDDRVEFLHHVIGAIPLECVATAGQLGIRDGDVMTLAAHVHRRRVEEGPAVAAAAMAVGRVANGDGGTRWFLDMTRNCDVVLEYAFVVLKEPGGQEGVHFRIDRRATGISLLFVAYADWLQRENHPWPRLGDESVPLDELRFVLGARRLPRDSDETAYDNGILDGDTIHVIRVVPEERSRRDDRSSASSSASASASDAAAHADRIGITLLHVDNGTTDFFLVDSAAPLRKVFHGYSQGRVMMPLASLRFLHGDRTLYPDDRPCDAGIRPRDTIHVLTKSHQQERMLELTPNAVEVMRRGKERGDETICFDPIVQVTGLTLRSDCAVVSSALSVLCMEYDIQTYIITPLFTESMHTGSYT